MTVEQILAALQAIIDGAKAPTDENPDATRELTEDEMARYEALEAQLVVARKSAEVLKRNEAYGTVKNPAVSFGNQKKVTEYERMFEAYARSGDKSHISRAQSEAIGSAGGFLVPEDWRNVIVEKRLAYGGLQQAAENLTTSDGRPLNWITSDETASNLAEITPEAALWDTGADLIFGTRTLGAYKYTTVGANQLPLKVSYELLQDSAFDLKSFIAKRFATRIARKVAVDLVTGTGVNEPQGIISTAGGIASTTARAAAVAPTYAELLRTVHAIDPEYREGASWLMNDFTLGQIRGVLDGANRPLLWNTSDDLSGSLKGLTLLGYPVVIDQAMPNVASSGGAKAILFGNLKDAYIVRQVKGFEMVVLNELYAQNGQVGFMGWERLDGMVQDPYAAIVLPNAA